MSDTKRKSKLPPVLSPIYFAGREYHQYVVNVYSDMADALMKIAEEVAEIRKRMDKTLELLEKNESKR